MSFKKEISIQSQQKSLQIPSAAKSSFTNIHGPVTFLLHDLEC